MTRPHTEFINAQDLEWKENLLPDIFKNVKCKVLSIDNNTGACSMILKYPKNWCQKNSLSFNADHELLILEGSMSVNDKKFKPDTYSYMPTGYPHKDWHFEKETTILSFFSKKPVLGSNTTEFKDIPIPHLYLHDQKWTSADIDPDLDFLRISHKILRHNKTTGDTTMILNCGAHSHPHNWEEAALAHPCVEEMFLLSGDIIAERGIMHAGAYFWRPPNIWHGPFGSRNGNVCLIRFLEGHHVNNWGPEKLPFTLTPDYKPDLPNELKHLSKKVFEPPTPY